MNKSYTVVLEFCVEERSTSLNAIYEPITDAVARAKQYLKDCCIDVIVDDSKVINCDNLAYCLITGDEHNIAKYVRSTWSSYRESPFIEMSDKDIIKHYQDDNQNKACCFM